MARVTILQASLFLQVLDFFWWLNTTWICGL
jgi:hypothetical protein